MGVDLTLMPLLSKDTWCSHDLIRLNRRRELWDPVAALPQWPIPKALSCHQARDPKTGETCYGDAETTPYGDRMTYTTAGDLFTLGDHEGVQDNWQNKAVWAYLANMPPDWPIVLYWS